MEKSLAEELYSEAMQSSSVALDRGSTPAQMDENLNDQEPDDFWCNDESSCEDSVDKSNNLSDMEREWQKRRNQFHTIGYRDGLIAGKETSAQEGFNIGFKCSVSAGCNWGLVRGVTSAMACLPGELKAKLVETEETRNKFKSLHESVQSISINDALKLFYEDHKRKSVVKNESYKPLQPTTNDSDHHDSEVSVLDDYYGQLQSLLEEAHLINSRLCSSN